MLSSIVISEASALLLVVGILAFGIVAWGTLTRVERLEQRADASEWTVGRIAGETDNLGRRTRSMLELFVMQLTEETPGNELTPLEPRHDAGDVHPFVADAVVSETEAVHGVAA